ncbi:FAD:protein FMN transferase [Salinispora vitiensis]|uniref:FAD:protein FMN transferase n=1 Tax=Salinispora vitiensis TaxID=999544 RepID=UPI00047709E2|nr:FAD:protein FMN transferase [Salinispora vitiensis]
MRMRIDEQQRSHWSGSSLLRPQPRPDLRLGGNQRRVDGAGPATGERIAVAHTVRTTIAEYTLLFNAPDWLGRRGVSAALRDAVAELRAIDLAYGPNRPESLVSRLRRGEVSPESYPPLTDLVDRCTAMRAATDGWFDAWAVPGGFDPGGLLGGWAVEQAATRLRAGGINDYAVLTGADLVVRGHAAHGGPWRVAVHHPTNRRHAPLVLEMTAGAIGTSGVTGRRGHVVDPHTGEPADQFIAATVVGPDLAVADAYATALYAAGPVGLAWFHSGTDYRVLHAHRH